ncbi:SDR family oxidoreductase [Bacillus sp. ISL-18]|uniref:SDR family NAD(P)-dependent oxidoreductase n=1 Tax=Bacillus sp. ISL-18 TaxID=2819118 RepID=UPI001BEA1C6B|nr:SDR family oxidoreductase [Bacillus sp. ISL-18]MBT2655110.1 SDR family oxidoreductase [Bacillus sp. ISL-18]
MDNLLGKFIMITGAARGIGLALARTAAEKGANLILVDRDEAALGEAKRECLKLTDYVKSVVMDITNVQEMRETVDQVIADTERIDVLINNAGIMQTKPFLEMEEEDWDRVLSVNLKGLFFLSQAVGKHMITRRQGSIIHISSIAARFPRPLAMHYGASKAAVLSLTKSMADFFGENGVRVNAVCPGPMETEMLQAIGRDRASLFGGSAEKAILDYVGPIPLQRVGQPEEVAEAALFLASDQAAYITGQALNVCGGVQMM